MNYDDAIGISHVMRVLARSAETLALLERKGKDWEAEVEKCRTLQVDYSQIHPYNNS